jgi:hypothetical protein
MTPGGGIDGRDDVVILSAESETECDDRALRLAQLIEAVRQVTVVPDMRQLLTSVARRDEYRILAVIHSGCDPLQQIVVCVVLLFDNRDTGVKELQCAVHIEHVLLVAVLAPQQLGPLLFLALLHFIWIQ